MTLECGCVRFCSCWFWQDWVSKRDLPTVARIDGEHFFAGPRSDAEPASLGFGGREVTIEFSDGRIVSTNNLWWQGVIPEQWRSQLTDNAKFIGGRP